MTAATDKVKSQEERQADLAPETHNDEQDEHRSQAQEVAEQARVEDHRSVGATESREVEDSPADLVGAGADMIAQMRDMEESGKIDMDAYAGEANHDDNVDKYGKKGKPGTATNAAKG